MHKGIDPRGPCIKSIYQQHQITVQDDHAPGPELPWDRSSYYMANLPALRLNHDLKTGFETHFTGFKIASIHDILLESSLITACANTCQNQTTKAKNGFIEKDEQVR